MRFLTIHDGMDYVAVDAIVQVRQRDRREKGAEERHDILIVTLDGGEHVYREFSSLPELRTEIRKLVERLGGAIPAR